MIGSPPKDSDGNVQPHDHAEIKDNDTVIRGITQHHIRNGRISSMAYQASSGKNQGMSVDITKLIEHDSKDPAEHINSNPHFVGAVKFGVGELREMEYKVGYDPITDSEPNPNPYHGQVWGTFPDSKKRKLARIAQKFVNLDGVNLR
jgi:hypothetical protein